MSISEPPILDEFTNVVFPSKFHELFTVSVDPDGQPVKHRLSEMTADEVLTCLDWHQAETLRLEDEAQPALEMSVRIDDGFLDPHSLTVKKTLAAQADALRRAQKAYGTICRLLEQLSIILHPYLDRHPGMTKETAIRRFWPGGR
jgi:hypothetical protein